MSNETTRLGLPLLQPAQAQKHVTVNEALTRLDGLVNLVLETDALTVPPDAPPEGAAWAVPQGAVNAWAGKDGLIALASNGGWVFSKPRFGQRAWLRELGAQVIFDGNVWVAGAVTMGISGVGLVAGLAEVDVDVASGTTVQSSLVIPAGVMVIGCNARVIDALGGSLTSWMLGTTGATNRFGQLLGKPKGSWARGILSAPVTYWTPAPVILTATGGTFGGGRIRLAAHWLELRLPN